MAVESATRIHQLNSAAPAGSEPVSEGAGHLRAIKASVKGSFPNFGTGGDSGVVTLTADAINALSGGGAAVGVTLRNAATTLDGTYANHIVYKANTSAYSYTLSNTPPVGTQFLVQNIGSAGNITIAFGGTLRWLRGNGSAPTTGNRTLAPGGSALISKVASNEFHIVGIGLS
jgi:hypothetical protein